MTRVPRKVRDHLRIEARKRRVLLCALGFADAIHDAEDRLDSEEDPVTRAALTEAVRGASASMERAALAYREVTPKRRRRRQRSK